MHPLYDILLRAGEHLPKKHGDWYRIHVYDNHWLVLDTWNKQIYHYSNGCEPTDTDNMYRVVYTFLNVDGHPNDCITVKPHMMDFWYGHLCFR